MDRAQQSPVHDPSTLAALLPNQPMELAFRATRSSQRLQGSWRMDLLRPSRVPESSRRYVRGDPVQMIDWKAFARTDQLIVREVRDEASSRVVIVVDTTATMLWPTREAIGFAPSVPRKVEIAWRVALNLAWLHLRAGDFVTIAVREEPAAGSDSETVEGMPLRSPADTIGLFSKLAAENFSWRAMLSTSDQLNLLDVRVDTGWWISDGLSGVDPGQLLGRARVASLFHVLSSMELDITWLKGPTCYFDEGRVLKEYQGDSLRLAGAYITGVRAWARRLEETLVQRGIHYAQLTDATAIATYQKHLSF